MNTISTLLDELGLFDRQVSREIASAVSAFPAVVRSNIFFEYELRGGPLLGGIGVGLPPGLLEYYLATKNAFFDGTPGRAVRAALGDDPFERDHGNYLNLVRDGDPDWIEYDVLDGQIGDLPFVFHHFPSRYRTIDELERLQGLFVALPEEMACDQLRGMLEAMLARAPIGMYRVGRAPHRGKRWYRLVVDRLDRDQIDAATSGRDLANVSKALDLSIQAYGNWAGSGTRFSLSVDIEDAAILNVDVECPYFRRIEGEFQRQRAQGQFISGLARERIISEQLSAWLSTYCIKEVTAKEIGLGLRMSLHHMKFRNMGRSVVRAKAYFHVAIGPL